jgi:hypothetical protein
MVCLFASVVGYECHKRLMEPMFICGIKFLPHKTKPKSEKAKLSKEQEKERER